MMSISQLIIISGLIYNPVPYERGTAACKNRAEPGADMTRMGYNGCSCSATDHAKKQLAEGHGGMRFLWVGSLSVADNSLICAGY